MDIAKYYIALFVFLVIILSLGVCSEHAQKMKCMEMQGNWEMNACTFPK